VQQVKRQLVGHAGPPGGQSRSQSSGAEHVSQAVMQMDTVTQQDAALRVL
jgi:methyl-accepting chemotaxis protein